MPEGVASLESASRAPEAVSRECLSSPDSTSVRVALRVRPLPPDAGGEPCLATVSGQPQVVLGKAGEARQGERAFTFDHVFDGTSTQESVYTACVTPLVRNFFDGYNATIFVYGQVFFFTAFFSLSLAHFSHMPHPIFPTYPRHFASVRTLRRVRAKRSRWVLVAALAAALRWASRQRCVV